MAACNLSKCRSTVLTADKETSSGLMHMVVCFLKYASCVKIWKKNKLNIILWSCFTHDNHCLRAARGHYLVGLSNAVALSSGVPAVGVFGPRWLPGPLMGGAVVVEVPAVLVLVGLPVAEHIDGGAGGLRGQVGLSDLQFLEVGVDRWLWASLAWRRHRLMTEGERKIKRAVSDRV